MCKYLCQDSLCYMFEEPLQKVATTTIVALCTSTNKEYTIKGVAQEGEDSTF